MTKAVAAYEHKARDQWLFDYPAQVSLCGTQIWWTNEVSLIYMELIWCCDDVFHVKIIHPIRPHIK